MDNIDLKNRTFSFAVRVIKMAKSARRNEVD